MTKISTHFSLEEFSVSGSFPKLVEPVPAHYVPNVEKLVRTVLQPLRDGMGQPLRITSGYRPEKLNNAVGGSASSQHRYAQAADCTCAYLNEVFAGIMIGRERFRLGQAILYPDRSFMHLALPSSSHPVPRFQIHCPKAGLSYVQVYSIVDLKRQLAKVR